MSRRSLVRWIARGRLYFPVARWVNRHADVVLANSYAVRQDVAEREGLSPESIQVIYNGTDTSAITPGAADESLFDDLRIPRNLPVVGMIANLHSYKGHLEMVRAAALLAERGVAFSLLFVGRDGNASTAIRKAASEAGLSNIVYVGLRSDVVKILRTIDVVVSASHEEGFSNSILEAMAAGRPVVATGVGGTNEQIVDGVNGLLVPPYEPVALAEAVGRLLGSPALRERLGAAARGSVIERYSLQSLLENTRALYERLTAPAGVSGSSPSRR